MCEAHSKRTLHPILVRFLCERDYRLRPKGSPVRQTPRTDHCLLGLDSRRCCPAPDRRSQRPRQRRRLLGPRIGPSEYLEDRNDYTSASSTIDKRPLPPAAHGRIDCSHPRHRLRRLPASHGCVRPDDLDLASLPHADAKDVSWPRIPRGEFALRGDPGENSVAGALRTSAAAGDVRRSGTPPRHGVPRRELDLCRPHTRLPARARRLRRRPGGPKLVFVRPLYPMRGRA